MLYQQHTAAKTTVTASSSTSSQASSSETASDATAATDASNTNTETSAASSATTTTAKSNQITILTSSDTVSTFAIGNTTYTSTDAVDISNYQSWMTQADFKLLKSLGVTTVVVFLGDGTTDNAYAATQIAYAKNAGLKVTYYHYTRFTNTSTATTEGTYVAKQMKNLGLNSYSLIFADVETSNQFTSYTVATNSLTTFFNALTSAGYVNHGLYTYVNYTYLSGSGGYSTSSLDVSHDFTGLLKNLVYQVYQNGYWYLYDTTTGNKLTGFQYIKSQNKTCYYDASGHMKYGQQYIGGHWYRLNSYSKPLTGFQYISSQKKTVYYSPKTAQMLYSSQKINNKTYYFNKFTGALQS